GEIDAVRHDAAVAQRLGAVERAARERQTKVGHGVLSPDPSPYSASAVEILAQGRAGIFRLRQAAALQLGNDVLDELGDVALARKAAGKDEATVGAGAEVQLLELVDDLLRGAARRQNAVDQETLAELLEGLLGIDGLEQLLEAAEVAL